VGGWRELLFVSGLAVAATSALPASADPAQLRPAAAILDGGAPLLPGNPGSGYAIPCVADWNGDGRKDLLVGYQPDGQIALYLNQGTDAQPCFTNFTVLKTADGTIIRFPSSGCGAPACWVCDFDGDGKRDLLVGAGADGTVWFYRNTNANPAATPLLAPGVKLKTGASDLSVGIRATPYVCDWDGDNLKDLLCGAGDGYVYFFKNTNTAQAPIFAPKMKIQAGGTDLYVGIRSVVRVFDWDGDGLQDLVCSSETGVYWCRNTNSNSNPILQALAPLRAPVAGVGLTNIGVVAGGRLRLDLVDWNDDGVIDLILGNTYGTVCWYEGYRFCSTRIVPQPANNLVLEWDSAPYLKYDVLTNGWPGGPWSPAAINLPSEGNRTAWTNQMQDGPQFFRIQIAP
jgi:FG-GAP-like repeat